MGHPSTLYRFWDASGRLLYVGVTVNPPVRMAQHARYSPWWAEAITASFRHFPDRRSAELAELEAIASEKPVFNRAAWNAAGLAFPKQLRLLPPGALRKPVKPAKSPVVREPFVMAEFIQRLRTDEPFRRMAYDLTKGTKTHEWLDFVTGPQVAV